MNDASDNLSTAIFNLISLVCAGLSVSWWILYFTDAFPVVGGLLGLGGFFLWIGFVLNILTKERKEQLQKGFDKYFLQQKWLSALVFLLLILWWLVFAPIKGTLRVTSLESSTGRFIEVYCMENEKPLQDTLHRYVLSPGQSSRILLSTSWFGETKYYVKVSGLPGRRVAIRGLRIKPILIPDTLYERPVILMRPSANLSGPVSEGFSFRVKVNDKTVGTIENYRGEAVWVGADDDVKVPERLIEAWRIEFIAVNLNQAGTVKWLIPLSTAPDLEFQPAAVVKIELCLKNHFDQPPVYSKTVTISETGSSRGFPEEVILDETDKI